MKEKKKREERLDTYGHGIIWVTDNMCILS